MTKTKPLPTIEDAIIQLPRCAESSRGCGNWVMSAGGKPLSAYCWTHAKAHGEVANG